MEPLEIWGKTAVYDNNPYYLENIFFYLFLMCFDRFGPSFLVEITRFMSFPSSDYDEG